MIRRTTSRRSGITLTEILISILILGVGMVSLATLFPLGLIRFRDAQRNIRSSYLYQSALSEIKTRDLLSSDSFNSPLYSPWYWSQNPYITQSYYNPVAGTPNSYEPWLRDTPSYSGGLSANPYVAPGGAVASIQGLPVAYDPLWRFVTQNPSLSQASLAPPFPGGYYLGMPGEARFASGMGFVRDDANGAGITTRASAHGLQRITNFNPLLGTVVAVPEIFVSPEDIVLQEPNKPAFDINGNTLANPSATSPLLTPSPNNTNFVTTNADWRYTWMFTGRRGNILDGMYYEGDIVIFENRPFAIDQVTTPFQDLNGSNTPWVVAGEPVVEAVWGFGGSIVPIVPGASVGYARASDRVVLLRWPNTLPDPDVRVGGWIADVTYERNQGEASGRFVAADYPAQRCNWYQIVKRSSADDESNSAGLQQANANFRCMTVWVGSTLKAKTLLTPGTPPQPVHPNAALVSPNVVNVFPASFTMHSNRTQ